MGDRGLLDLIIGRFPGISPADRIRLCTHFDGEAEFTLLSGGDIEGILKKPLDARFRTMAELQAMAERDAAAARLRGIAYVSYAQREYPPLLREIYDPPVLLFYRGLMPDPEQPLAAVVGTRKPSGPAAAQAYDIARELGRNGVPAVSGLALGIDALAHRGNLDGGGATVAVLGSGLDQVYPAANRTLARRIVEGGGVLLSEYPPGTEPRKWHFPARNRIIAGLARGTLLVEAPETSGALITARFALEQGRDLWVASSGAVPGNGTGEGTRKLAGEGARVVSSGYSILAEWGIPPRGGTGETPFRDGAGLAKTLARQLNLNL
ncbi:MAG: DNA-processing protein DprA [Spirochaetaceae bacterium]|jgi:DNA processing protein|nr:DNA-processing protein DprA [Spirochaetaceae bacterium]